MTQNIVAVVLAGGSGKRWWPLSTYKAILPMLGSTVLELTLEGLVQAGLTEAIVVTSPQYVDAVKSLQPEGITITVAVQKEANGMAGAVLSAEEYIKDRPCLIVNAGDLLEGHYFDSIKKALFANKPFIGGMKIKEYFDSGYLRFDGDRVVEIVEKPGKGKEPSTYVYLVFDYFPDPKPFFHLLKETISQKDDVFELALSKLLKIETFGVVQYDGFWVPMKYPWHVLDYLDHRLDALKEHRGVNLSIKSNVVIEGTVFIGDNVKIFENTKIVGPCYIGDSTIIGNNTMIRESYIGANCVVGFNTDIARSYVGDSCWFHSNYIGDSVLEGNISLGSGTVLANLRLDEGNIFSVVKGERMNTKRTKLGSVIARNVRIGVNTSIMPGVKIGMNSMIGAGIVVDHDILENSFIYGKTELVSKPNERNVADGNRDLFRKKI